MLFSVAPDGYYAGYLNIRFLLILLPFRFTIRSSSVAGRHVM